MMYKGIEIIAEVKTQSPFGYKSKEGSDELFNIADLVGDIISVHIDSRWGGYPELIAELKKSTMKYILAKGLHLSDSDIKRSLSFGADYVLVYNRIPDSLYLSKCFIEPRNLELLSNIPKGCRVVWNSRDLETSFKENRDIMKSEKFEEARKLWKGWLCQASGIRTVKDIKEGADAVLVGTHLKEFVVSLGY